MDNEIIELQKQLEKKKQEEQAKNATSIAHNEIQVQYDKNKQELQNSDEFKQIAKNIVERGAKAELTRDMIEILSEEQKNELTAYILNCEKQKLDYRKKKEKGVIMEEVKSEIADKKIKALKKRYGYLYKQDDKGEPINFVANKAVNKYKEFCNWWEGTSDGFKRFTKATLKIVFWVGIAALVILLGYRGFKWMMDNTQNLPNIQ